MGFSLRSLQSGKRFQHPQGVVAPDHVQFIVGKKFQRGKVLHASAERGSGADQALQVRIIYSG